MILSLAGLVFLGIAMASLVQPHVMAEGLGYRLDSVDALSEFRAIYVGLWVATAVLLLVACARVEQAVLGDLGAILILGQVSGRLISLVLDGAPSARIWAMFALEAAGGALLLLVRPAPAAAAGTPIPRSENV